MTTFALGESRLVPETPDFPGPIAQVQGCFVDVVSSEPPDQDEQHWQTTLAYMFEPWIPDSWMV